MALGSVNVPSKNAPAAHADTTNKYGAASATMYGHVMLSDALDSQEGASTGKAASPLAVKKLNEKIGDVETLLASYVSRLAAI